MKILVVKNKSFESPQLNYNYGDLITLYDYFPKQLERNKKGFFDGQIKELNW